MEQKDFKIELVSRAAKQGCETALKVWADTGYYLGVGLANLVLTLDVDTLVITGGVSGAAEYFMPALKRVFDAQQIKTPFKRLKLLVSQNPDIGGVGAAMYAIYRAQKETLPA